MHVVALAEWNNGSRDRLRAAFCVRRYAKIATKQIPLRKAVAHYH